jgi:hypothetical protein
MTPNELRQRIQAVYRDYVEEVQDAGHRLSAVGDLIDAVAAYARAVDDTFSVDAGRKVVQAYMRYARTLQLPGPPDEMRRGLVNAYRDLLEALQELLAPAEAQKRLSDAYRDYLKAVQDALAPVDVQEQLDKAYSKFLRTIKTLWGEVDLDTQQPDVLLELAQAPARAAAIHAAASASAARLAAAATIVRSALIGGIGQQIGSGLGPQFTGAGMAGAGMPAWR